MRKLRRKEVWPLAQSNPTNCGDWDRDIIRKVRGRVVSHIPPLIYVTRQVILKDSLSLGSTTVPSGAWGKKQLLVHPTSPLLPHRLCPCQAHTGSLLGQLQGGPGPEIGEAI